MRPASTTPPDLDSALATATRICGELESGVLAGPSGAEYRQRAIYDLADAARAMLTALTRRRRLEVVTYRDPDGDTSLRLLADGVELIPDSYEWCDIDPGRAHLADEWHTTGEWHAHDASPAAAAIIRQWYRDGAETEYIE